MRSIRIFFVRFTSARGRKKRVVRKDLSIDIQKRLKEVVHFAVTLFTHSQSDQRFMIKKTFMSETTFL